MIGNEIVFYVMPYASHVLAMHANAN